MSLSNVFDHIRFEHDDLHVYFLPPWLRQQLETSRPAYLVGSRGTGKTTLLKALYWKERLHNRFLIEQLAEDPFAEHLIGAYIKLPRAQLTAFSRWLERDASTDATDAITAVYFELMWVEALTDAVSTLLAEGVLTTAPVDETRALCDILGRWPALQHCIAVREPAVRDLHNGVRDLRRHVDLAATVKSKTVAEILEILPFGQLGEFVMDLGRSLALICDPSTPERWFFKVCLDEAESLNPRQLIVLNSLVRHSERPVLPVVAFVRMPDDPTTTLNPRLRLQAADRELIILNEDADSPGTPGMSDRDFKELAEGIINVRLRAAHQKEQKRFSAKELLGPLDINRFLQGILTKSESEPARKLLAKARDLSRHAFFRREQRGSKGTKAKRASQPPPIYQTYLAERLGIEIPTESSPKWKRRQQDSAELRKRMVAAYLSLCDEFHQKVTYASADMVFQMSDKCVRDFLLQLRYIYREVKKPLGTFLRFQVPIDTQNVALRAASNAKRELFVKEVNKAPAESDRLIDALGRITATLQCKDVDHQYKNLLSSERGQFCVRVKTSSKLDSDHVQELLKEAHEVGYLRLIETGSEVWRFRVHCSLAAAYGFSYRGAEYPTPLNLADLAAIGKEQDRARRDRLVDELAARLAGRKDEGPTLFDLD